MKTLQAPAGGKYHDLSDKFYEGGQFMPEPDRLAGAKRKAAQKAKQFNYNEVTVDGLCVCVRVMVRFVESIYEPYWITRSKAVFTAKTEEEAREIAASLPPYGRIES